MSEVTLAITDTSIVKKFEKYYEPDPNSGCWLWFGATVQKGYGQMRVFGRKHSAHRLSYLIYVGEIPAHNSPHGMCVLHHCDNPACVNPKHLFLGTNADNMRDKAIKGRAIRYAARGEQASSVKLSESDVVAIRNCYGKTDDSYSTIAKRYGVDRSLIYQIVRRKIWTHI